MGQGAVLIRPWLRGHTLFFKRDFINIFASIDRGNVDCSNKE